MKTMKDKLESKKVRPTAEVYLKMFPHGEPLEETTFEVGTIVVTPAAIEMLDWEPAGRFLMFLLRHGSRLQGTTKTTQPRRSCGSVYDTMCGEKVLLLVDGEERVTTVMMLKENLT